MQNKFIQFRMFDDAALAENLIALLIEHNVPYGLEQNQLNFNPNFNTIQETAVEYVITLAPNDFERVNQLIIAHEEATLDEIDDDHYLHKFTDKELTDILVKPDEWSFTDIALAGRLLKCRGVDASAETIQKLKEEHLDQLRQPEKQQNTWIIIGYFFSLMGGVLGLFIGWHLMNHKKILPNGERIYNYAERDRKHGRTIFIIGLVVFILNVAYPLLKNS